ncbi:hypothetical protein ACC691_37170, partial [Rhizobium johnstonii]
MVPAVVETPTQTVVAGGEFVVNGAGFTPGDDLGVWLHSTPVLLGTAVVGSDGTVSYTVTIPANTPAGVHHIVFVNKNGVEYTSADITVTAAVTGAV